MARTSFQKDCINLFYGDDGEDIAEYIHRKLTSDQYNIVVYLFNISLGIISSFNKCVQVIFLTPEVHKKMKSGEMKYILDTFEQSRNLVLLYHSSVELQSETTKDNINSILPYSDSWKLIPLGNGDKDFKRALLEVLSTVDSPEILPVLKQFTLAPTSIWNTEDEVFIILRKDVHKDQLEVRVTDSALEKKIDNLRQINSNTLSFRPNGLATGRKKVEVTIGGEPAGRSSLEIKSKLDMLHKILHDTVNPIELLCQTLDLESGSREGLDLELHDIFTNGGANPLSEYAHENFDYTTDIQKNSELPTLLHFGARYGLENLCVTLLTFPGGMVALRIKNKDGRTPYKLAIYSGYTSLADTVLAKFEHFDDDKSDEIIGEEEDHYMTMAAVNKGKRGSTMDETPKLPPRSQSFNANEIPVETNYSNVIRRQRGHQSERRGTASLDSGAYSDDSQHTSWIKNDFGFQTLSRNMTVRMTKLWADDEVRLPESTKL